MPKSARMPVDDLPSQAVSLTIVGSLTTAGQSLPHLQYLTEEYVVTEVGRSVVLHSVALGGRFIVDRTERRLRRVAVEPHRVHIDHLRELIGRISIHRDETFTNLDGFHCRRYRLCNDGQRIVISAEAFCTRYPPAARTALHLERTFEARLHPLSLPLDRDEVVVRSTTHTFSNGFQHTQCYQLLRIDRHIDRRDALDELLAFPLAPS
jgi:hypothetical protein